MAERTTTFLGWPAERDCPHCGARAVHLVSTYLGASYECRGTPTDPDSAYGPDGCGRVFSIERTEQEASDG